MCYSVLDPYRLFAFRLPSVAPADKVFSPVRLRPRFAVAVDIGKHRRADTMPQVRDDVAEWLKLVIRLPFGKLSGTNFPLRLVDCLA
jgi:hypothetical protein